MKKLIKFFTLSHFSFTTKVIISFFVFVILFMLFKTILTIPKIEEKALNDKISYVTRTLLLTKEKLKIVGASLKMQSTLEVELNKQKLENEILKLNKTESLEKENLLKYIENSQIPQYCSYKVSGNNIKLENIKDNSILGLKKIDILGKWVSIKDTNNNKGFRKKEYFFYNKELENQKVLLELICNRSFLNPNHMNFEMELKKTIHTDSLTDSNLKSTKVALVLLNINEYKSLDEPALEKNENIRKKKYTISMLSNVDNIPTGNITVKEIVNHHDEEKPIFHKIGDEDILTWVIKLNSKDSNSIFFLLYSIQKDDLLNTIRTYTLLLLPESLIAIGISLLLMFFFFKRVLQNLNTLTKTAIAVNNGKKNIRSNVRGEDDIGILGTSFDSMLDFFEDSIDTLDKKVQEKTKEITKSLEEKETLLKEIHHRVKNNLALTISFIELQEDEIEDENIKKVLIDIKERIYTMELIHRKLYESTSLNKIPFKSYIVDLVDTISKTHSTKNKVLLNIEMDEVELDIESAMPYGLILNELITNAFKYAFVDNESPKLKLKILKKHDDLFIELKDNGKGLPKDFEKIVDKTLGLRLINTIVKYQLFGSLNYKYNEGSVFLINGKLKDKE